MQGKQNQAPAGETKKPTSWQVQEKSMKIYLQRHRKQQIHLQPYEEASQSA